jgi:hypothetical protein
MQRWSWAGVKSAAAMFQQYLQAAKSGLNATSHYRGNASDAASAQATEGDDGT